MYAMYKSCVCSICIYNTMLKNNERETERDIIARKKVVGIILNKCEGMMNYLYSYIHRNSLMFTKSMHYSRFV